LICRANNFNFDLPQRVRWARRILIKPCAGYPMPYPISTSRDLLAKVVSAIRKVSEADIILLEGSSCDQQMKPIYRSLGYDFPRVLALDVKENVYFLAA
jgi:hypothetical protein